MSLFRLICYQNMQEEKKKCPNFELRFCCDENTNQFSTESDLLNVSYSEIDFGVEAFQISRGLQLIIKR